jgi:hypothetical protein
MLNDMRMEDERVTSWNLGRLSGYSPQIVGRGLKASGNPFYGVILAQVKLKLEVRSSLEQRGNVTSVESTPPFDSFHFLSILGSFGVRRRDSASSDLLGQVASVERSALVGMSILLRCPRLEDRLSTEHLRSGTFVG